MAPGSWPWSGLASQAGVIERLASTVDASSRWRWLEVCCSLAAGRGDERSDVDAAIGYADGVDPGDLDELGRAVVEAVGEPTDVLVHVMDGWPPETRRFAVQYADGVPLDLVLLPATRRTGLPTGSVAVVDKDGRLATPWRPPVELPPSPETARQWLLLGWWALGDVAKYVARGSLFEAAERLAEARAQALRLHATGSGTPFPGFGLVSLLDFPPFELPEQLATTYPRPVGTGEVRAAAVAVADLLDDAARRAGDALGTTLATPWAAATRRRLAAPR
jgi:hypothetical protein